MYALYNKDGLLATFDIVGTGNMEKIDNVSIVDRLPFWITDIASWLSSRSAAKHRKYVKRILKEYNAENFSGFIGLTNCLSMQDTLWVKSVDSRLTWSDVNLFNNEFSEVMTHLAFDGTGLYGKQMTTTSPELTTDGAYDKCWVKESNGIYLLKTGSTGARNAGLEPFGECMASQFYNAFCSDAVPYDISLYHNKVVTKCKSFATEYAGYKPISLYMNGPISSPAMLEDLVIKLCGESDSFKRMIIADSVMLNSDRHFGNFGFLVDNQSYGVIKFSPIFDFNMALVPYAEDMDFADFDKYIDERGPVLNGSYVELAQCFLDNKAKRDLKDLKDLQLTLPEWCFDESMKYHFTQQRVYYMNMIKNVMIDRILGQERDFLFVQSGAIPVEPESKSIRRFFN